MVNAEGAPIGTAVIHSQFGKGKIVDWRGAIPQVHFPEINLLTLVSYGLRRLDAAVNRIAGGALKQGIRFTPAGIATRKEAARRQAANRAARAEANREAAAGLGAGKKTNGKR